VKRTLTRFLLGCSVAFVVLLAPPAALAIDEFTVPTANSRPGGITVGPDGALWFTEENGHKIGRITTGGSITEFPIPHNPAFPPSPQEITAGPDGALWFTEFGANPPKIGRITGDGTITECNLPPGSGPDGITTGPDRRIWFTQNGTNKIGVLDPSAANPCATIAEYPLRTGFKPGDITTGPDGRLWFTESEAHQIGAITTAGDITEFSLPAGTDPSGIAASGASLWFTQFGAAKIGRISTVGALTGEFGTGSGPSGIAFGPPGDDALWFTETLANKIGRMTTSGSLTEFAIPTASSEPGEIVLGPDRALWFTEFVGNKIGRIVPSSPGAGGGGGGAAAGAGGGGGGSIPTPAHLDVLAPIPGLDSSQSTKKSKRKCRVPKVRGLSVRRAKKKLRRARCRYKIRGKGRIVSTSPRAGKRTSKTVRVRAKRKRRGGRR
jgi:virginiamycin B lyase